MINAQEIETALKNLLPSRYKGQATKLAQVLAEVLSRGKGGAKSSTLDAASAATLKRLASKSINVQGKQIHFGSGNEFGDVQFGPVVGGDMINITLTVEQPSSAGRVLVPLNDRPRIFISHHATEPATKHLMEKLREELERRGYNVVVDKERLLADATWQNAMYTWMGISHAAIVLFSKAALESEWVAREVSLLTARPSVEDKFTLVPVLLEPLGLADLEKDPFHELGLASLMPISVPELTKQGEDPVAAIVAAVTRNMLETPAGKPKAPYTTNLQKLEDLIVTYLDKVRGDRKSEAYRRVASELNIEYDVLSTFMDASKVIARALWQAGMEDMVRALSELAAFFGSDAEASELSEILMPIWVDPRAARWIPGVARRQSAKVALGVNGSYPIFTGFHFVYRAFCLSKRWRLPLAPVTLADAYDLEAVEDELFKSIKQYIYPELQSSQDLRRQLSALQNRMPPIVIVGPPMPDRALLEKMIATFENVTFFLLYGTNGREMSDAYEKVQYLRPDLGPDDETMARNSLIGF